MRFTTAAVASGLAAVAVAESNGTWAEGQGHPWGPPAAASGSWGPSESNVWTTEVVTAFTTFCPEATAITHGGSTYSVSSATTLTITNCPGGCTISKPVSSSVVTVCSTCWAPTTSASVPAKPTTTPVAPKVSVGTTAPWKPSTNGTAATSWKATGTGSWSSSTPSSSSITPYKGDASKASFGVAGLLAAVGLIAAL